MAIQFVDFKNEYFDDFKGFILPNIYHELISSTVMAEDGLFCIGALDEERPIGALVARLSADRELDMASIYVDKDYRRQQVGSALIDHLLAAAVELIDYSSPLEDPNIGIMLNCEYSLPEDGCDVFKKFLISKGFTMHTEYEKLMYLEPDDIKALAAFCSGKTKKFPLDEDLNNFDELLQGTGIQINEKLSFYTGPEDDPSAMLLTGYGFDGVYFISQKLDDSADPKEIEELLFDAIKAIADEHEDETLIINMECNIKEFYDLLKDKAVICVHAQSMAALAFEVKEAN